MKYAQNFHSYCENSSLRVHVNTEAHPASIDMIDACPAKLAE